jgi:hypothetical protein
MLFYKWERECWLARCILGHSAGGSPLLVDRIQVRAVVTPTAREMTPAMPEDGGEKEARPHPNLLPQGEGTASAHSDFSIAAFANPLRMNWPKRGNQESPLLVFPRPRGRERVADLPGRSTAETGGRVRDVGIRTNSSNSDFDSSAAGRPGQPRHRREIKRISRLFGAAAGAAHPAALQNEHCRTGPKKACPVIGLASMYR